MEDRCSFCGSKIIEPKKACRAGVNGLAICEDCIKLCYQTIKPVSKVKKRRQKRMTPIEIKEHLDKYVIGQDDSKISIAIAVYNHYKRLDMKTDIKLSKSNVLLIGPTGSGKTLLAQTVADLLDVPFAIADCTSLTEAGYVGDDVENVLVKLLNAADGDVEKAERGIVFLDEIDKIAKLDIGASLTKDPSGAGVQQALLKLIEGTIANVPPEGGRKNPSGKNIEMNTENILFICGGAFQGLETIINERTKEKKTGMGFGAIVEKEKEKTVGEAFKLISPEDLVKYGLIPELIGRLPVVVSLDELDENAMVEILTKPKNNIVDQYKAMFDYDGIELQFSDESLKEIAKETIKRKTGARGLRSIMEETLKEYMFRLPSEPDVKKCIVHSRNNIEVVRKEQKVC